jgi:hypothetical protein
VLKYVKVELADKWNIYLAVMNDPQTTKNSFHIRLTGYVLLILLTCSLTAGAQEIIAKGILTDENAIPLPWVNSSNCKFLRRVFKIHSYSVMSDIVIRLFPFLLFKPGKKIRSS